MFKDLKHGVSVVGPVVVMVATLFVVGCSKKIAPVGGSTGLSNGLSASTPTSPNSASPGTSVESGRPSSGGEVTDQAMAKQATPKGNNSAVAHPEEHASGSASHGNGPAFLKNVYFDYDQALVRRDAKTALEGNSRWLALNSSVKIKIEGHGDERGTNDYNLALGERRARSIMRYLVNLGINKSRFSFISYGEERSVCSAQDESCYQQNRRVHFLVKK